MQPSSGSRSHFPINRCYCTRANAPQQAALQVFPDEDLQAHIDFQAVFHAVSTGAVDRGIHPVENSTNGFVVQILDLFAKDFDVSIVDETFVSVQQALLGYRRPKKRRKSVSPQAASNGEAAVIEGDATEDWSRIKTLYSHPQAWGQCTPFLTQNLRHAERIDTTSTSKAAELVAQDESGESAAICSTLAAELYGLDILVPSIEERKGNTTRFLVLQKSSSTDSSEAVSIRTTAREGEDGHRYKTLISFTIPHTQPASLANALECFGKHGINFTSLNSRPQGDRKWNYIFFVEFWGRKGDEEVDTVMREVASVVEDWKWIGSWPSKGDGG